MSKKALKSVHLKIPPEIHKKMRVACALKDTTISKYVTQLVELDLSKMMKKPFDA